MKPWNRPLYFWFALSALFLLCYQNCTKGLQASLTEPLQIAQESKSPIQYYGNGEGYGGKLNGIYAVADSLNKCEKATASHVPVREQIEINEGFARKTVENCQPILNPPNISISDISIQSESGDVFILQDSIYQKGEWVPSGWAPRDKYVDVFCRGRHPSPLDNSLQRLLELSIYKDLNSLAYDLPWDFNFPFSQTFYRQGHLRLMDQNPQTAELVKDENKYLSLQETMIQNLSTNIVTHDLQIMPDAMNIMDMLFQMTYLSPPNFTQVIPQQMSYGSTAPTEYDVQFQECWTNK